MRFKLDSLMRAHGVPSAYALAARTGLPITTATRLVKKQVKRIDFDTLDALCITFNVPVSALLERDDPAAAPPVKPAVKQHKRKRT